MNIARLSRLFVVGVVILSVSAAAFAVGRGPGKHGMRHKARIQQQLGLTQDQRTQIQTFHQEARAEAQRIRNSNLTQAEKRTQLRALYQRTHERVLSILTPEQRTKLEQLKQNRRSKVREFAQKLNLTPAQKEQAMRIKNTARQRIQSVRTDPNLTDAQKRERIASIRNVARRDFLEILTPQQREMLQKARPGRVK